MTSQSLVKQHLKLRLLWSAKPVVIHQQTLNWCFMALRLEIAVKAGVLGCPSGCWSSMPPAMHYEGRDPVQVSVGFIRPSRRTRIHVPAAAILPGPARPRADLPRYVRSATAVGQLVGTRWFQTRPYEAQQIQQFSGKFRR